LASLLGEEDEPVLEASEHVVAVCVFLLLSERVGVGAWSESVVDSRRMLCWPVLRDVLWNNGLICWRLALD